MSEIALPAMTLHINDVMSAYASTQQNINDVLMPVNRVVVFEALEMLGIATAVIDFDGQGDSGCLNELAYYAEEFDDPDDVSQIIDTLELLGAKDPGDMQVEIDMGYGRAGDDGAITWTPKAMSLDDAVKELAGHYLEQLHGGWENNDGAYGHILVLVPQRKFRLCTNFRVMSTEYEQADI
jgi:hypothetical protein